MPCFHCGAENHDDLKGKPFVFFQGILRPCWLYANDPAYAAITPIPEQYRPHKRKPPSLAEQIKTFAEAVKQEMFWRSHGGKAPAEHETRARYNRCIPCPERDIGQDRCKLCGCFLRGESMPLWMRIALRTVSDKPMGKTEMSCQKCPAGKWGPAQGCLPKSNCG